MKKLKIMTALIALLVCLTGCQSILTGIDAILYADTYDPSKYVEQYCDGWQYQQLNATQKDYYGSIYTAIMDTLNTDSQVEFKGEDGEKITTDGVRVRFSNAKMRDSDLAVLFEAVFRDNPQFFYLNREYRIEGSTIDNTTYYDTIILQYFSPVQERQKAIASFEASLSQFLADLPDGDDQFETELFLYDRLAKHCTYDKVASKLTAEQDPMAYTAYGAIVDKKAVCEGYAKAMQLLLTRCGIRATSVSGDALWSDESHMWNLVEINGETYYLDPTWSDNDDAGLHTYFNITTEMLARTHKIDERRFTLPRCDAMDDNYFVRNGTYIDTYERRKIAEIIANCILNKDTTIQLQFSPKTFDNGLLFIKNSNLIFEMVNEHLKPHNKSLWDFTLWTDKKTYVLTIEKAK